MRRDGDSTLLLDPIADALRSGFVNRSGRLAKQGMPPDKIETKMSDAPSSLRDSGEFHHVDAPAARAADAAIALEMLRAGLARPAGDDVATRASLDEALAVVAGWLVDGGPEPRGQAAPLADGLVRARQWADAWLQARGIDLAMVSGPSAGRVALSRGQWLRLALLLMHCIGRQASRDHRWELRPAEGLDAALDLRPITPVGAAAQATVAAPADDAAFQRALVDLLAPWGGRVEAAPPLHLPEAAAGGAASDAFRTAGSAGWRLHLAAASPSPAAAGPVKPLELLYVEDDPLNLLLVQELALLRPGIALHAAPDGRSGLALASQLRPALIFVDLHLPDIDGFEVLRRLRADPALADTPVLALSASTLPGMVERSRQAGFAEYWRKPIQAERFMAKLDAWLARLSGTPRTEGDGLG